LDAVARTHAGAIERYYTEDSSMQENAAAPRVGRDLLVAHERGVLARMSHVYSKAVLSVVEGDNVAVHWIFELTDKSGKVHRIDEVVRGRSGRQNSAVIPGRCEASNPESRDSPMCNCTSGVWC
jgi:hypothetical protein